MSAIVTAYARLCADRGVAEICVGPRFGGVVAGVARQAGDNVILPFASGLGSVMATRAAAGDFVVVHLDDRFEVERRVTRFALIRR